MAETTGKPAPMAWRTELTKFIALVLTLATAGYGITNSPSMAFRTFLPGSPIMAVDPGGFMYVANLAPSTTFPCTAQINLASTDSRRFGFSKIRADGGEVLWTACLPVQASAVVAGSDGTVSFFVDGDTPGLLRLRTSDAKVIHFTPIPQAGSSPRLAVDSKGSVYVAFRAGPNFAPTPGSINQSQILCTTSNTEGCRAALLKISELGSVEYATYLGVENSSDVAAIQVDSSNAVWVAGVLRNSAPTEPDGGFAVKLDSDGKQQLALHKFEGRTFNDISNPNGPPYRAVAIIYDLAIDTKDSIYLLGVVPQRRFLNPPSQSLSVIESVPFLRKIDVSGVTVYVRNLQVSQNFRTVGVDAQGNAYIGSNVGSFVEPQLRWPACTGSVIRVVDPSGANQIAEVAKPGSIDQMAVRGDSSVYVVGELGSTTVSSPGALIGSQGGLEQPGRNVRYASKLEFARTGAGSIECVENAATLRAPILQGQSVPHVAPGELITIFGSYLPSPEDIRIDFDGLAAPILYADDRQINAAIPFDINANGHTRMVIRAADRTVATYDLPSAPASPGTFGWNGTQAVALNEDGSVNTFENGASPGSTVTIFVSGAGVFAEPVKDGELGRTTPPFAKPVRQLGVYLKPDGGVRFFPAEVLSVVQAPGLINGTVRVNLRLPATLTGFRTWVFVADGGISSENTPRAIILR